MSKMKPQFLLFLVVSLIWFSRVTEAQTLESQINVHTCTDSVFIFQTNFWVNFHLFLRAESRSRSVDAPLQMPVASLSTEEQPEWKAGLDAYAGMAKLSLISDDGLVRLTNTLAEVTDATVLPSNGIESRIATALNRAAPVYGPTCGRNIDNKMKSGSPLIVPIFSASTRMSRRPSQKTLEFHLPRSQYSLTSRWKLGQR